MVNTRRSNQFALGLILLAFTGAAHGRNTLPKIEAHAIEVIDIARPEIGVGEPFAATLRVTVTHNSSPDRIANLSIHEMAMLTDNVCVVPIQRITLDGATFLHRVRRYNDVASVEYVRNSTVINGSLLSMDCQLTMFFNAPAKTLLFREPGDYDVTLHASNATRPCLKTPIPADIPE